MGLLIEGHWKDQWYESSADGAFQREQAQRRHWVTANGAPGPSGEGGFQAEAGRECISHAMDVHGGKGMIMGPNIYLGRKLASNNIVLEKRSSSSGTLALQQVTISATRPWKTVWWWVPVPRCWGRSLSGRGPRSAPMRW